MTRRPGVLPSPKASKQAGATTTTTRNASPATATPTPAPSLARAEEQDDEEAALERGVDQRRQEPRPEPGHHQVEVDPLGGGHDDAVLDLHVRTLPTGRAPTGPGASARMARCPVAVSPGVEEALPRGVDRLISERRADWALLTSLVQRAETRGTRLDAAEVLALGEGYRAAAADLARARQRWPGDPVVDELDSLVRRARAIVYRTSGRRASVGRWLTTGMFVRIRERPRVLLAAIVLLWGPSLGFALWADHDPATATRVAQISPLAGQAADSAGDGSVGTGSLAATDSAALATQIFTNNIRVTIVAFAGGIAAGIGTAALLVYQGVLFGAITGLSIRAGNGRSFFELVTAHGVLELSCIVVASAAGLRMGWALVSPGHRRRGSALAAEARSPSRSCWEPRRGWCSRGSWRGSSRHAGSASARSSSSGVRSAPCTGRWSSGGGDRRVHLRIARTPSVAGYAVGHTRARALPEVGADAGAREQVGRASITSAPVRRSWAATRARASSTSSATAAA